MKLKHAAWISLAPIVGCGEPSLPEPVDASRLDWSEGETPGEAWRDYLEPAALNRVWAPSESDPWRPYHKHTLFAAIRVVRPAATPIRGERGTQAEKMADAFFSKVDLARAAVFVDLPGPESVAWGAALARKGAVPVGTFNSWPHHRGLIKHEQTLGALLYYAEEMSKRPKGAGIPVFLMDGNRIGRKDFSPSSDVFDNRYFHMVADFPSAAALQARGLTEVFYVARRAEEEDDLNAYFQTLQSNRIRFFLVNPDALLDPKADLISSVRPFGVSPRVTIFDAPTIARYASGTASSSHYRSYPHYHGFWVRSRSTFGDGRSSGRGWGGSS